MPNVPKRISNTGTGDAADVTYTPIDNTDWDGDVDPGNVDDALDELAERTDTTEGILNELLPAAAPDLGDITTAITGVSARLSFGPTASSNPAGYIEHPTLDVGDLFNTSSPNKGVIDDSTDISGTINESVVADASNSYPENAFGPGDEGTLTVLVNSVAKHSVDLSSFGSGVSQNGNGSGFNLSASTPVDFPSGSPFSSRQYRTGTWNIDSSDLALGYNEINLTHTTTGTVATNSFYYIVDDDSTATTILSVQMKGLVTTGSKSLSGIEYNTGATATMNCSIGNAYRKTYSDGNAISYPDPSQCTVSSVSYPDPGASGYTNSEIISQSVLLNATRIIAGISTYDGFRARVRATRPLLATITSSYTEAFELLVDSQSSTGTDLSNDFNDELGRLLSNDDFDTDLSSTWDETISLVSATSGYDDGLQTINGGLSYPSLNFSTISDAPAGNPDYSSASGDRFYYGLFTDGTGSANFRLTLQGSGVQVIPEATGFTTAAQIKISIKLPEGDVSGTGWLDITQAFVEGDFSDGDGCYAASFGSDQTINTTNWGLSVGTRNTSLSFDKVYYRITAPDTFTGELTEISIEWAVV